MTLKWNRIKAHAIAVPIITPFIIFVDMNFTAISFAELLLKIFTNEYKMWNQENSMLSYILSNIEWNFLSVKYQRSDEINRRISTTFDCWNIESVSNEIGRSCASQANELIGSCTKQLMLSTIIHSGEAIIHLIIRTIEGAIQIGEINQARLNVIGRIPPFFSEFPCYLKEICSSLKIRRERLNNGYPISKRQSVSNRKIREKDRVLLKQHLVELSEKQRIPFSNPIVVFLYPLAGRLLSSLSRRRLELSCKNSRAHTYTSDQKFQTTQYIDSRCLGNVINAWIIHFVMNYLTCRYFNGAIASSSSSLRREEARMFFLTRCKNENELLN